jgi:hypothetical protein
MSQHSTQEIERHYFTGFLAQAGVQPEAVLYADRPDVQVTLDGRRVGVEITRLFLTDGSYEWSEQVQAPSRAAVLALAQKKFISAGGPPIEVHVDFNPLCPIANIERAASDLVELVISLQPHPRKVVGPGHDSTTPFRYLYQNGEHYADAKWKCIQVYSTPMLDTQRLEEVVSEKARKSAQYSPCDAYWLLVAVDFMDRAQDQEVILPHGFRLSPNPFERVYVYKPQLAQVIEVPGDA